jgi:CRP-like cAMP-binding protein
MEDDVRKFGLFRNALKTTTVPAGTTVFSEGDEAKCMYAIKSGRLEVRIAGNPVRTMGEDEIFGEMALLNHRTRSATVVALEESVLVPVDETQFILYVKQNPYFALQIAKLLADRLRSHDPLRPADK